MTGLQVLYLAATAFTLVVGVAEGFQHNWIIAGYALILAFIFSRFRKVLK